MQGKLDDLGRIVVPAQYRHELGIVLGRDSQGGPLNNEVEIQCDGSQVTIRPLHSNCVFCGAPAERELRGKGICARCAGEV